MTAGRPRLLLLPAMLLLAAAAAPQTDCSRPPPRRTLAGTIMPGAVPPSSADAPPMLGGPAIGVYSTLPVIAAPPGCNAMLPSAGITSNLRDEAADTLHGLPDSDALAPVTQLPHAPLYD